MKSVLAVLLFIGMLFSSTCIAADDNPPQTPADVQAIVDSSLSPSQTANLMLAKEAALAYCPVKAECATFMKVTLGIAWQETRAGAYGPVGDFDNGPMKRSYGIMQTKLDLTKQILEWNPKLRRSFFGDRPYKLGKKLRIINMGPDTLTDEEILAQLIVNPKFNVAVGVHVIKYLRYDMSLSWAETVRTYNQGYANRNNASAMAYFQQYQDGTKSKAVTSVLNH